jgi:predicted secreted hydrolase
MSRRRHLPASSIVLPRSVAVLAALAGVGVLAALLATAAWRLGRTPPGGETLPAAPLSVAPALRAPDPRGFARALEPRPFVFPADHGSHPEYRTEWWYYTGNLTARDGRRFGFQLTFFRSALAPPPVPSATVPAALDPPAGVRSSAWATRQVWFAHFAVTDAGGHRFLAYERWERQALGLAGAEASPFRVWVGPWSAAAAGPEVAGTPPMHLAAGAAEAAVDLVVNPAMPPVPQGDRGLSAKSAEPGNASYYYSLPRLVAAGTLRLGGERIAITGLAWMDREWSTSSLAPGEVGWDWFGLQLDDGWELMLYRLRRRPPAPPGAAAAAAADLADPASLATLIAPDGRTTLLPLGALRFAETGTWTSPAGHTRYPSGWRLTLPGAGPTAFDLTVKPLLAGQELRLSFRYWEGAVAASGAHGGRPVTARGYVELTGYGDARSAAAAPRPGS